MNDYSVEFSKYVGHFIILSWFNSTFIVRFAYLSCWLRSKRWWAPPPSDVVGLSFSYFLGEYVGLWGREAGWM